MSKQATTAVQVAFACEWECPACCDQNTDEMDIVTYGKEQRLFPPSHVQCASCEETFIVSNSIGFAR